MPDPGTFDQALAELEALPPAEQEAVLARLDTDERRHLERFRSGPAEARIIHQPPAPFAAYSPWLRTLLEDVRSDATSARPADATRATLMELGTPPAAASPVLPVSQRDRPGASLMQVAGGLLRGRKGQSA